jgi:hypothetical protein
LEPLFKGEQMKKLVTITRASRRQQTVCQQNGHDCKAHDAAVTLNLLLKASGLPIRPLTV